MRKFLGTYNNGSNRVYIFSDGTKIRYGEDKCEFPESIDLCVTHKCDGGCSFCYDNAGISGRHAELVCNRRFAQRWMEGIRPFTELAMNANDLSHPKLREFLEICRDRKIICNLTINLKHFLKEKNILEEWQRKDLFHGLGISISERIEKEDISSIRESLKCFKNIVFHIIVGTETGTQFDRLEDLCKGSEIAVLFLGYKNIGRGEKFAQNKANEVWKRTDRLKSQIRKIIESVSSGESAVKAISFDCLGYQQLRIKDIVSEKGLEKFYMGEDGTHTMYIDAVEKKYARSSTDILEKKDIGNKSLDDMFQEIRI